MIEKRMCHQVELIYSILSMDSTQTSGFANISS